MLWQVWEKFAASEMVGRWRKISKRITRGAVGRGEGRGGGEREMRLGKL